MAVVSEQFRRDPDAAQQLRAVVEQRSGEVETLPHNSDTASAS
jgi:hypothetical protein